MKENTKITIFLEYWECSNNEVVIVSSKKEIKFIPTKFKTGKGN
jgi:hypothetical protein